MQRTIHRFDSDSASTLSYPSLDAIDETSIWLSLGILPKPIQVDHPWIISTTRLELNVAGLPIPSENATNGGATDPEHLRGRDVRLSQPFAIGVSDAFSQIERNPHPDF